MSRQDRHRATFRDAEKCGLFGTDGVHHGPHVVHPFLERADLDAVGESHASLVEHHEPRERGEPLAEAPIGGTCQCANHVTLAAPAFIIA